MKGRGLPRGHCGVTVSLVDPGPWWWRMSDPGCRW